MVIDSSTGRAPQAAELQASRESADYSANQAGCEYGRRSKRPSLTVNNLTLTILVTTIINCQFSSRGDA